MASFRRTGQRSRLRIRSQEIGQKSWAEVINPAIELASKGFPFSYRMAQSLDANGRTAKLMAEYPDSKRIFLGHAIDDNFVQPELAATLKRIQDRGANEFYEGETALKLADAMKANGGLITLDDLRNYKPEAQAAHRQLSRLRHHYIASAELGRPSAFCRCSRCWTALATRNQELAPRLRFTMSPSASVAHRGSQRIHGRS